MPLGASAHCIFRIAPAVAPVGWTLRRLRLRWTPQQWRLWPLFRIPKHHAGQTASAAAILLHRAAISEATCHQCTHLCTVIYVPAYSSSHRAGRRGNGGRTGPGPRPRPHGGPACTNPSACRPALWHRPRCRPPSAAGIWPAAESLQSSGAAMGLIRTS